MLEFGRKLFHSLTIYYMAHVKFSIHYCYLDYHNNYSLLFSGSLPDTLTIHYVALSEDRKRMKLKQVEKKRNWEKGKKLSQYFLSLTIQTRNISPGVSSAGRPWYCWQVVESFISALLKHFATFETFSNILTFNDDSISPILFPNQALYERWGALLGEKLGTLRRPSRLLVKPSSSHCKSG